MPNKNKRRPYQKKAILYITPKLQKEKKGILASNTYQKEEGLLLFKIDFIAIITSFDLFIIFVRVIIIKISIQYIQQHDQKVFSTQRQKH